MDANRLQNIIETVGGDELVRSTEVNTPDVPKDPEIAKYCRVKGDDYHSRKLYFDAIVAYNRGIAHEATGSVELGLLYAKRSAVYFDAKIYSKCRENIELARKNNFPAEGMAELEARQAACKDKDGVFDPWSFIRIESVNEAVPFIADCLKVIKGIKYGRHIVTTKALKAGDIIAIEEPYFTMWYEISDVYRCKACMKPNQGSLIPCPKCAKVMYCSKECRRNDCTHLWKHLEKPKNYDHHTASFRLAWIMYNLALQITGGNCEETIGFIENEGDKTVFDYDFTALDLDEYNKARLLCVNTLTMNGLQPSPPDPLASDYDNLLYRFMYDQLRIFQTNSYYLHEMRRDVSYPKRDTFETTLVGSAIYPFASLINNSCYPNVKQITVENKLVLVVTRPIKAKEQLFVSYGYPFFMHPQRYRQDQLLRHYGFVCLCQACSGKYPLLPLLPKADRKFYEKRFTTLPSPKEAIQMFKKNCAYINKNIKETPTYEIIKLIEENDNLLHSLARADFI